MNRALKIYREYPRTFWMMIVVNLLTDWVDRSYSHSLPYTSRKSSTLA